MCANESASLVSDRFVHQDQHRSKTYRPRVYLSTYSLVWKFSIYVVEFGAGAMQFELKYLALYVP